MGQYFYFFNATKGEMSEVSLAMNFGSPWMVNFQNYPLKEQISIIEDIIKDNEWNMNDKIIAFGDYSDNYTYSCSADLNKTITFDNGEDWKRKFPNIFTFKDDASDEPAEFESGSEESGSEESESDEPIWKGSFKESAPDSDDESETESKTIKNE